MASADPEFLAEHGYVQEEFIVSGTANCYATPKLETGSVVDSGIPYTTRIMVRRPADSDRFNGTVAVEWLNATSGYEIDSTWAGAAEESYLRPGSAWVGVSVQNNVVEFLRDWSPERYGSLDVEPPESSDCPPSQDGVGTVDVNNLAFDIMSQVGQAIQSPEGVDPLGGLDEEALIATGASQSSARLVPYINSVHPIAPVYDGFFLLIPVSDHEIRQDAEFTATDTKVFKLLSEWDIARSTVESREQPDSDTLRAWEVAGAPHTTAKNVEYRLPLNDRDGLPPIDIACPDIPQGAEPISQIPLWYVAGAASEHLGAWVREGTQPPASVQIETEPGTTDIVRDAYGNALGGIRLSQHEVATATSGMDGCSTYGWHQPFNDATLAELYPSHGHYVRDVVRTTRANERSGYILRQDAQETIRDATHSNIAG